MRKAVRLALGGLGISLLVSCQAGPNSTGAPTPSPAASLTPSQTAGPSPSANPALTAEAERVKATFQAYQTDTAAEKATERAGTANPQAPASPTERPVQSLLDPGLLPRASRLIDPATVLDLELLTELPAAAIDQLIIQPQGAFMAVLGQGQIQLLDLSGPSANSRSAELESSAPHQGAISTDGLFLAVIGSSDSAQLWQITSRALVPVTFASSIARPEVPAVWLAFGPTSRELAIFFPIAATILSWELSPEQTTLADPKVAAWNREVHAAQLSPDWSEISWQFESTIVSHGSRPGIAGA